MACKQLWVKPKPKHLCSSEVGPKVPHLKHESMFQARGLQYIKIFSTKKTTTIQRRKTLSAFLKPSVVYQCYFWAPTEAMSLPMLQHCLDNVKRPPQDSNRTTLKLPFRKLIFHEYRCLPLCVCLQHMHSCCLKLQVVCELFNVLKTEHKSCAKAAKCS